METLQDKIKALLLTHLPQDTNTPFIEKIADLVADTAVFSIKMADKLEREEMMSFDTSDWVDSKIFMCALGREIERQYQRPVYTVGDKRKNNAAIKAVYDKM